MLIIQLKETDFRRSQVQSLFVAQKSVSGKFELDQRPTDIYVYLQTPIFRISVSYTCK